ncbi:amino acid adenylation domain-containing protein [Kitasatospora purpeofusca]|uniref:Amino acid adenylation domain-containing protein n=1 Tax=Kitasatospora purpeofusca TaxID=67352 RepID=A0ABZ1UDC9_9ACTN|nr:amino acid adenylation domain-containing protein [Kitasatospora purpeofusca]
MTAQPVLFATLLDARRAVCLPDLLRAQAAARPDATAVTAPAETGVGVGVGVGTGTGARLSFRELAAAADALAAHLHRLGVATDDCVGLYTEPSLALMTGAWGILHAGAAYLPLSPEYPEERLRWMIESSGTRVVVAQEHLRSRLAELVPAGTRIVTAADLPDRDAPPDTGAGAHHIPHQAHAPAGPGPESLAYVIHTSGSTGRPKGVMIEHHSIVSQLRWLADAGHLGQDTTVLQKTPMSFDAAQWEILAPAAGARVVMGAPGVYRDPEALIDTVLAHGVTTLQCVPTLLQALLDTERLADCTGLRGLYSGGEALSVRLARALTAALPGAELVNLYGPTECTINATAHRIDPETLGDGAGSVPIGVPVDRTRCFVLDEELAPVEVGATGELYIGGVQLARGYLNRPDLTAERFVASPYLPGERLYRTGDLAEWNPDGTLQCAGRVDNQVKLRGYRVELDEIALAVEEHTWVRRAAAVVTDDPRTGHRNLVACVELNPKEAALMDQGNHGGHHRSKASKLQVRAQLSNPGLRGPAELAGRPVVELPGCRETGRQRRETFARKTYRFFEGGPVTRDDLLALLAPPRPATAPGRPAAAVTLAELGPVLRWFGQFHSPERLLPKYAYASPGALYATQLYLETDGSHGLAAGVHYYHPVDHALVRVGDRAAGGAPLALHFLGRRGAIEPVYRNNIQEVLEFEAGHMLGVLEEVLPEYGLAVRPLGHEPSVQRRLDVAEEDYYLGSFAIVPADGRPRREDTELFVQAHPGGVDGLPAGLYRHEGGELTRISDQVVESRHVIAINQQVYRRAGFGITAVSRATEPWLEYIGLGSRLHRLQRNGLGFGFMSSGYSSKSGHPLPAARRIDAVLAGCGIAGGPSYFFLGGRVSEEQIRSEGMREDAVHMRGPAELIRDELVALLPDYMVPNRVLVLDELPLTANGKVDAKALAAAEQVRDASTGAPFVAPATPTERRLAGIWAAALKYGTVSTADEFFAAGGNSLIAVALVNRVNREFGTRLPLQVLFECPRLADLAARIDTAGTDGAANGNTRTDGAPDGTSDGGEAVSRLVPLHRGGAGDPVFCWPGLGGYPMNLRPLAGRSGRPFYGVQAYGINPGETPYPTIREMAAADLAQIRAVRPEGPYTLWGYSFGARVAFEAAWQLERAGERVAALMLICPGNPELRQADAERYGRESSYRNPAYLTILHSVFAGSVGGPGLAECLAEVRDEDGFAAFVHRTLPELDEELIRRVARIVGETYEFEYTFRELAERRLSAPVTVFKATGDDYSFIEGSSGWSAAAPATVRLAGDHYGVLREQGVDELAAAIAAATGGGGGVGGNTP